MTLAGPTDPSRMQSPPENLFDALAFPPAGYCEAFSAPSQPRDHWRPLLTALGAMQPHSLGEQQERIRRMRHQDGATYNPFDDPSGRGIPWALDLIPIPLTESDWSGLEAGMIQRASVLESILADIYGPQDLLKEGRLPPELVFANPRFLHACHGIQPAGKRFLTFYAADVYRGEDGRLRVFRDLGANPSGLGYVLENRIVLSRVLSEVYHGSQIRRLAPFFHSFQTALARRAPLRREDPGVVLLSPGPDSRIYFEHALLSRYLGYPLVEGQDLTVRNGEVFLKKLEGLEPVETIFRHIEDCVSDPFALRRETSTGVAGLIQVSREGNIGIVNPIGSGFVDTPSLAVFLPDLCRHMTGQGLLLENHPAWWCGTAAGRDRVMADQESLIVGSAMNRSAAVGPSQEIGRAIEAAPYAYMAWEPLRPAVVPACGPQGIRPRYTLMRLFACATDRGFSVLPGGLAICAADVETLTGDSLERQQSKDIWILSNLPVESFSLMRGLQEVSEFKRGSDLPSRVADNLLWLGRYLERAEGLIRLLRSVFRRLSGEARSGDIPELPFLLNLLRSGSTIPQNAGGAGSLPPYRELSAHLNQALHREDRPGSVIAILKRVREAARKVRDRLSLDAWRVINRLEELADMSTGDPLELLDDTLFTLSAFSGLAMESMTRGLGWRFMDIGRRVERAINQAALIRAGLFEVCTQSCAGLEALLEVSDSIMTYRARYRTAFQLAPVLDLLLADESNPKSLAFQLSRLASHVGHLPLASDRRFAVLEVRAPREMLEALRNLDLKGFGCGQGRNDIESLAAFLECMEIRLKDFAQQINAQYLTRVPATPHFSSIRSGPTA